MKRQIWIIFGKFCLYLTSIVWEWEEDSAFQVKILLVMKAFKNGSKMVAFKHNKEINF